MEEILKDIGSSSVISTTTTNPTFPSTIFQDFLSRPFFNNEPPTRSSNEETSFFSFLSPPPATTLCLNSGSGFQYMGSANSNRPPFAERRVQENNGNRRQHKLMKYRESAARSRARKLAHRKELELEVARLREENAKLRKQKEKLLAMAAPNQFPKKNSLRRTLTAPF
ncbi:hypothetical protein like AT4G35900 [Hibiscus trionum]|uniref:BZIP domain-containing protein n=1 Tax=Hibiscus trionum TaxID=183268 RepID=A0A9W7M208_HIBTR|nr:hypothetical protein like AT4G35900 [Hibiscus trionum]